MVVVTYQYSFDYLIGVKLKLYNFILHAITTKILSVLIFNLTKRILRLLRHGDMTYMI